jgi:peptide/nickel transport system substrate-binding protein
MKTVAAALALVALGSCQFSNSSRNKYDVSKIDASVTDGGVYVDASIADASMLNPLLATDSASNDINGLVYNGLLKYDKDLKLTPDLAERWDVSNNGRTITFTLKKNILWHDGKPFTSDDILFTYQQLISSTTRTPFSADYKLVKKAEILAPYIFRVTYDEPFAPALESWGMGIIPKHIYEGTDINTNPANRAPIGTGPYIFKEWVPDEKIVLTPNPNYYEGKPHFTRYIYRIIPDSSVQFLELRQGTLSTMAPTPDQYNGYDEFYTHYNKYKYPGLRYDYFAFNLKNDLFKDLRVRQALAHAVNKRDIVEGVYAGYAVAATGPFPPVSWAFNSDVPPISYDLDAAKALLEQAGWKDTNGDGIVEKDGKPFEFTVLTNQANKVRESIAQILQSQFAQIGIKMNIRILEWTVFLNKYVDQQQFDAVILGWNLSADPDPYPMWHSDKANKRYNFVSYSNPVADRLIIAGRKTFDPVERANIYHKLHRVIADDVPYIFLVYPERLPVVHKKILNVKMAPAGLGWNFNNWFIPSAWQEELAP